MWEIIFWVLIFIVFYTYLGYGLLMAFLVQLKHWGRSKKHQEQFSDLPKVTFLVAAYNEAYIIEDKIHNSLLLEYDPSKLKLVFVTDGSTDGTKNIVEKYPEIKLFHQEERRGKVNAINRLIPFLEGEIIVFSDANTMLNQEAILNLVRHFTNPRVGMVAGEKTIMKTDTGTASQGEGIYWRYESWMKKNDAEMGSVIGAAGELFAIRRSLLEPVPENILIEDFYLSLKIIKQGYKIEYEPKAIAVETGSASIKEELKRKVRISAGGLQAIYHLADMLNIFRYGMPAFQFLSHRVLRWTLTPLSLPMIFLINIWLIMESTGWFYQFSLAAQVLLYGLALIEHFSQGKNKLLLIPYYFLVMNWSVFAGFVRLIRHQHSVTWEKSKRVVADKNQ